MFGRVFACWFSRYYSNSLGSSEDLPSVDGSHLRQHTRGRIAQEVDRGIRVEKVRSAGMQAPEMEFVTVIVDDSGLEERSLVRLDRWTAATRHDRRTRGTGFVL